MPDTTAPAPVLTPTQVAIAAMRAQRGVVGYPATGNEWLLLDALDESEVEAAQLRQHNARLLGEASALQADLKVATRQLKRLDKELIRLRDENASLRDRRRVQPVEPTTCANARAQQEYRKEREL